MQSKTYIFIFLIAALETCCQDVFVPRKYEQIMSQAITALEAKKKMLDQKIKSTREHQEQAARTEHLATSAERAAELRTITDANVAVLAGLEGDLLGTTARLKNLMDEKNRIVRQGIKSPAQETLLIRKATLQFGIDDIKQRIAEAQRAEAHLDSEKSKKKGDELRSLITEKKRWAGQRLRWEAKLRKELGDLQKLK